MSELQAGPLMTKASATAARVHPFILFTSVGDSSYNGATSTALPSFQERQTASVNSM
jgi:hypothetical protein